MPKKQPKNAFFFFMLDYKKKEEAFGTKFPNGMRDVSIHAAEPWKKLNNDQKEKYERMAKAHKQQVKQHGERYTSQGIPLSQVQKEDEERQRKLDDRKTKIDEILNDAVVCEKLPDTPFYIISFNYFVKDKDHYYPAELGLVRFSINGGITKKYHKLINPGKLPLGHAFQAKDHAEKTHQLQTPPKALGENDYTIILNEIVTLFVEARTCDDDLFPILVIEEEMEMVERIVQDMCEKAEIDYDGIRLLPLAYFFQKLRETADLHYLETKSTFTFAIAQSHLERDQYQYHKGNGCRLHEAEDVNIHCALSKVTRWAYYVLDQTMDLVGVQKKVAGFHFPKGCIIDGDETLYSKYSDDETEETEIETHAKTEDIERSSLYSGGTGLVKREGDDDDSTLYSERQLDKDHKRKDSYASSRQYAADDDAGSRSSHGSHHDRNERSSDRDRYRREHEETRHSNTNPFNESNFPPLGASTSGRYDRSKRHNSHRDDKKKYTDRVYERYDSKRERSDRDRCSKRSPHSYERSRSRSSDRDKRRRREHSYESSSRHHHSRNQDEKEYYSHYYKKDRRERDSEQYHY